AKTPPPPLRLLIEGEGLDPVEYVLEGPAIIGRDDTADIRVDHQFVSRRHVEVFFEDGSWCLQDLQSRNGTFLRDEQIDQASLRDTAVFTLGRNGPRLTATVEVQTPAPGALDRDLLDQYANYYLKESADANAGERTLFIRHAFRDLQRRQRRRNG